MSVPGSVGVRCVGGVLFGDGESGVICKVVGYLS